MLNTILGEKTEMSQQFVRGTRVPVTKVKTESCVVTQVKDTKKDGYWAVQLGLGNRKINNVSKAMQGHIKGAKLTKYAPFFMREVRLDSKPEVKVGDILKVSDLFSPGDVVSVTGTSKGKGFEGVVKKWGFAGLPRTHGTAKKGRSPGSIGQGTTPGRVRKGKKMGGRSGNQTVTIKNLTVVSIDPEIGEIAISGPVPGSRGSFLVIKKIRAGRLADLEEKKVVAQAQVEGAEENQEEENKEADKQDNGGENNG